MGTATTTFTLTVQAAPTTVLGSILDQMTTEFGAAGGWSTDLALSDYRFLAQTHPLRTGTTTISQTIDTWGGGALPYASGGIRALQGFNYNVSTELLMGNAGPYATTGWDEQTGLWHVAGTTGSYPYSQAIVRYDPTTDQFRHWGAAADGDNTTALWPYGGAHNFGQSVFDPLSRRIFRYLRTSSASNSWVMGWAYIDDLVDGLDRSAARRAINADIRSNSGFVPIRLLPNKGAAGTIIELKQGTAPFGLFDLATNTWSAETYSHAGLVMSNIPACVTHQGYVYMAFARIDKITLQTVDTDLWRISEDGTVVENMGATPVPMNGSAYYTDDWYHTEFVSLGDYIYAFVAQNQAIPGNDGLVYRYIPGGSWELLDDLPLKRIGVPLFEGRPAGNFVCYAACAVPGVSGRPDCVIVMNTALDINGAHWGDRAYVWKPSG